MLSIMLKKPFIILPLNAVEDPTVAAGGLALQELQREEGA